MSEETIMTEEQKAAAVSDLGKYIASLNSITTGEHLELSKEELPKCVAPLSSDCWISYLRL